MMIAENHQRLHGNTLRKAYLDVHLERVRAHTKHGANGNSREDASWDDKEWLPILMEELGEVAHCLTYDAYYDKEVEVKLIDDLHSELIQVAAMAIAWAEAIEERMESTD